VNAETARGRRGVELPAAVRQAIQRQARPPSGPECRTPGSVRERCEGRSNGPQVGANADEISPEEGTRKEAFHRELAPADVLRSPHGTTPATQRDRR